MLEKIDFSLIPGERIGLLGLNGAGKTTFIKLLADELSAFSGEVTRARDLQIGYFAQHQVEQLDLDANAILTMQRLDAKLSEREIRSYLGGFNFRGEKVLQPITDIFRGTKSTAGSRLADLAASKLAVAGRTTNHLDLEMRLALNRRCRDSRAVSSWCRMIGICCAVFATICGSSIVAGCKPSMVISMTTRPGWRAARLPQQVWRCQLRNRSIVVSKRRS